ncbi:MAG: glycosyltransferase family 1 protein, partial [Planctomycetota bacterium]
MRVLYLTDSLSDLDGVGRYAMRLIAATEKLQPGLEVEVLLARKHRPTSKEVPKHWQVSVALPPDYFYYMQPSRFWPSYAWGTWNTWRAARRADVVHAIKDFPHNLVALRGAELAGKPCIATAHGTYSVIPLLSQRHAAAAQAAYRRFAALISVSRYTSKKLLELSGGAIDPARLHVIPNCVDASTYAAPRADVRDGSCAWHGLRYTLAMGELKERKGHHLSIGAFLRVAARFPDLHHCVVGKRSNDDYERAIVARIAAAGCAQRVHFLGNVDEAQKIDLFQRAFAFVHTPVTATDGGFEGFGIVYLEASASGIPCIGTLDSGAEDAVVDGVTGMLVPQREDDVAAALERLLEDDGLRRRMGEAGRAHAAAQTWEANARAVLSIYRDALATRAAPASASARSGRS